MYPQVSTNIKGDWSSPCQNKRPYPQRGYETDIDINISPRGTLDDKVQFRLIPRLPSSFQSMDDMYILRGTSIRTYDYEYR